MSFDTLGDLNWLAVIVAAIASFAFGAVWYAPPVLGKTWAEAAGIEIPADGQRPGAAIYAFPFIGSLLGAIAIGMLSEASVTDTAGEGLVLGLVVGIGFGIGITLVGAAFESQKPSQWTWGAINAGYQLIGALIAGLIIGAWQ